MLSVFPKDREKIEKSIDPNAFGLQRKKFVVQTVEKLTKKCVSGF
jgi:hypothetical protein